MGDGAPRALGRDVLLSILYYALCSSVVLVLNKVVLSLIPLPSVVFLIQFAATVVFVVSARAVGLLDADRLTSPRAWQFAPYALSFVISIYSSGKALQHSNVETLITFRSCSPLCLSITEWIFLGRELPSRRSLLSLVGVAAGSVAYVLCDRDYKLHGVRAYGWVAVYLTCNVFEMTYGKLVIARASFEAPIWGSVFYTNALALGPMALLAASSGEARKTLSTEVDSKGLLALGVCCSSGIAISWSGWNCRDKTSATTYALLGVACKLISVLINVLIWDNHATPVGLAALVVCLQSSALYQQAPLRAIPGQAGCSPVPQEAKKAAVAVEPLAPMRLVIGRAGAMDQTGGAP